MLLTCTISVLSAVSRLTYATEGTRGIPTLLFWPTGVEKGTSSTLVDVCNKAINTS